MSINFEELNSRAYLAPESEIYLLQNVPLDRTYKHTLSFSSRSAQETYFKSKAAKTFNANSFQGVSPEPTGVYRSDWNRNHALQCNYMMFRNPQGEGVGVNKWFYAFITDIEYRNNDVSFIHFELDLMQTYYFDYDIKECWVEREHTNNDSIGSNTVPENLDVGDYVEQSVVSSRNFENYSVLIGYVQAEGSGSISATYAGGQFSGVLYQSFPCNSVDQAVAIGSFLAGFTDSGLMENIVSITFVPSTFISSGGTPVSSVISPNGRPSALGKSYNYTPRNKKLLTFPYCFLSISNGDGDDNILKYELFNDPSSIVLSILSSMSNIPQITLIPKNYAGEEYSLNNRVSISDFPQCAYATDSYKAYQAMNTGQQALNLFNGFISSNNLADSFVSLAAGITQNAVDSAKASVGSTRPKGSQSSSVLVSNRLLNFYAKNISIRAEYARILDDYFDKFGYATNRLKAPNRTGRKQWNYVKTRDCTIVNKGSYGIPASSAERICQIYDNGITFWHNPSNVGDYSLDNTI